MQRLASAQDVLDAHLAVHTWCDDRAYDLLGHLVDLDLVAARATFGRLAHVLDAHMAFEEAQVLPAYRPVAPADGPGRADHVDGDHTIIRRHVDAIAALLDELEAPGARRPHLTRRDVLERLPVVYRLIGTLEHHTAREQQGVYPAVAAALDDDARAALHQALRDVLAGA